ncbi:MAG TPA: GspH/FimT family pseudopilin [Luteimonas sp.]|jgi:type IV fimbrial biogenesis protein FimT|nr:GspH/FimT family pseudopilin [Luteimonas sp.]
MPHRIRGFTLVEAAIALALISLLVGAAVPAWSGALESAHATSAKVALVDTLTRSISHAALAGSEVVMCPGATDGCRDTIDWSHGWIAYADIDGNRQRGPNETLLQVQPALAGKAHLRSTTGRTRVVFQPNGGNAGSNITFTLCDGRGAAQATTLVLANDGRLRAGTPTPASAAACLQPM